MSELINFFHVSDLIGDIANPWTRGERAVMNRLAKTQQLFFCTETAMLALRYERGSSNLFFKKKVFQKNKIMK